MARRRLVRQGLDAATAAEAISRPGIDPREWISSATVADEDPVEWDPEMGPLLRVVLHPSGKVVRCRILTSVSGDGEGEYPSPFVAGDEVVVAFPEGSARGNGVVLGRVPNARTPFPTSVAGQDPTTNAFGFVSRRAPYFVEVAGPYLLRSSLSGAFIGLDAKGGITMRDGQGAGMQFGADHWTYQGPGKNGPGSSPTELLQLDVTNHRFTLQVEDALVTLSGSSASPGVNAIATPGPLSIQTNGTPASEHVVTTEAVANIVASVFQVLSLALAPVAAPLTGTSLATFFSTPAFPATLAAAMQLAATTPLSPLVAAAIHQVFSGAPPSKPPGSPGLGQTSPSIGCAGLIAG